jgi:hypothetical protein
MTVGSDARSLLRQYVYHKYHLYHRYDFRVLPAMINTECCGRMQLMRAFVCHSFLHHHVIAAPTSRMYRSLSIRLLQRNRTQVLRLLIAIPSPQKQLQITLLGQILDQSRFVYNNRPLLPAHAHPYRFEGPSGTRRNIPERTQSPRTIMKKMITYATRCTLTACVSRTTCVQDHYYRGSNFPMHQSCHLLRDLSKNERSQVRVNSLI